MFAPPVDMSADAETLLSLLRMCTSPAAVVSSPWLIETVTVTLGAFRDLNLLLNEPARLASRDHKFRLNESGNFRVALPTPAQLDGRCLLNCFQSSQKLRDVSLSQGFQQYGERSRSNIREVYHMDFLTKNALPALVEHYGDWFVSLQVC